MGPFVEILGFVIRTEHVSAVGPVGKADDPSYQTHFIVYPLGAGGEQGVAIWGTRRQLIAARNKLLRAMGAKV